MKRLLLIFVFVLVVCASWASSAQLKIMAGANLSRSTAPLGGVWFPETHGVPQLAAGVLAGGGIEFSLSRTVALEVDGLFVQKGSRIELNYWGEAIGHSTERMNELSFPAFLKIYLKPGTSPYLLGGGEVGFVLAKAPDPNNYGLASQRTEYGLVFGVGFRHQIGGSSIAIEGRYHHGLQDMVSDFSILRKMRTFSLLVGFSF